MRIFANQIFIRQFMSQKPDHIPVRVFVNLHLIRSAVFFFHVRSDTTSSEIISQERINPVIQKIIILL